LRGLAGPRQIASKRPGANYGSSGAIAEECAATNPGSELPNSDARFYCQTAGQWFFNTKGCTQRQVAQLARKLPKNENVPKFSLQLIGSTDAAGRHDREQNEEYARLMRLCSESAGSTLRWENWCEMVEAKSNRFTKYIPLLLDALRSADPNPMRPAEAIAWIRSREEIPANDLTRIVQNGTQSIFENDVHWARFFLVKAGLLGKARRGLWNLTLRGVMRGSRRKRLDSTFGFATPTGRQSTG